MLNGRLENFVRQNRTKLLSEEPQRRTNTTPLCFKGTKLIAATRVRSANLRVLTQTPLLFCYFCF